MNEYKFNVKVFSSSVDDIRAGAVTLNTPAQMCSKEVSV